MTKLWRLLLVVTAVLGASMVLAACGGDDDEGGDTGTTAQQSEGGGKEGGEITIAQTSQPDYLDPALSYTVNGWEPMWLVYTPLLTYRHEEGEAGAELVPGVAESMPEVSNGGKTYTFTLRKGLKYSDGSPLKASDVEHGIKRMLNLESGGSSFFFDIEGAEDYQKGGKAEADIPGIETDDAAGTVTFNLSAPNGSFNNVIAMLFAAPVPQDTPFKNMTKNPPPGIGAYKITSSVPNREFVMEKNENFSGFEGVPQAKIDKITTKIIKSPQRQAQQVISGELDYIQDPPPADLKPEIKQKYEGKRYKEFTTLSTYYFFMNQDEEPFDDPKVREAVHKGLDKPAIARLYAGELQPGCSFLPPGMPGYDKELDTTGCPAGDPSKPGDLEAAKAMLEEAGVVGQELTVYGNNDDPTPKVTQAYADQLEKMGFKTKVKILDGGVYFQTIGNEKTKAQTGFLNWFGDFPHPYNFMFLVDPASIQPTNSQNINRMADKDVGDQIVKLKQEADINETAEQWGALDRRLVEQWDVAPYGHRKLATFFSERMDFENCAIVHPLYQNDYSRFCLK